MVPPTSGGRGKIEVVERGWWWDGRWWGGWVLVVGWVVLVVGKGVVGWVELSLVGRYWWGVGGGGVGGIMLEYHARQTDR